MIEQCIWCKSTNLSFEVDFEFFDAETEEDIKQSVTICKDCSCIHFEGGGFQIPSLVKEYEENMQGY